MGPKLKKAASKRLTKADRLRLQQEEEERRLKEEEEARLRREKEEQRRLELQRVEKEKWQRLEAKDLERRGQELEELSLLELCYPKAERLKQEDRALAQWNHYVGCDGSPDPTVAQEINTFISLWKEETKESFEEVVEKSKLVLELIETLKLILLETPQSSLTEKSTAQYQDSILELQELLQVKFNSATELLLRYASTFADPDSGNMEKVIQNENVTLYVWANLKKNPRHKTIKFTDTEIGFEIPKILASSDIALRLLHTRYDHVSPLRASQAAPHKEPPAGAGDGNQDEDLRESEEETPPPEELQEEPQAPEGAEPAAEGEAAVEMEGAHRDTKRTSQGTPRVAHLKPAAPPQAPLEPASEAEKMELGLKLLSSEVLKAQMQLLGKVVEKPVIFDDQEVDLCQFSLLGGVYHLDILHMPPQCKPIRGWVMVEILKEGLKKYIYPPEAVDENDIENIFPPLEVTLMAHPNVVFFEDPMVARWDAEDKCWKTSGINSMVYSSKERLVTFSLDSPGPVTLFQDAHLHMPFQSWELRPFENDKVLLTLTTVFAELKIHIREDGFMLGSVKLANKAKFSALEGKWMRCIPFILALREAGLNIFPSDYSHFYVVINNKVPEVELKAYRQMSLLSSAFVCSWSKWNLLCDSCRVVFKVREHLMVTPPRLLMFSGDRAQVLRIDEMSETFSGALKEDTEFHSTLYHMVKDFASAKAMARVHQCSARLVDSVCSLLLATRLLSYS